MTRSVLSVVVVVGVVLSLVLRIPLEAQSPARADTGDAAVAALVAEVRALRADMAAASRNQLRAQLLLGRVQMQEQRLAYIDKQRSETSAMIGIQEQMSSGLRSQVQGMQNGACSALPNAAAQRDCEANAASVRRQLADQQAREEQMRAHQRELEDALATEQARWSDFNSRLDELERSLR